MNQPMGPPSRVTADERDEKPPQQSRDKLLVFFQRLADLEDQTGRDGSIDDAHFVRAPRQREGCQYRLVGAVDFCQDFQRVAQSRPRRQVRGHELATIGRP